MKSSLKSNSYRKRTSHKSKAYIGKEMDSEEELSESDAPKEESSANDSDRGMACIVRASTLVLSSFFDNDDKDDEAPAPPY